MLTATQAVGNKSRRAELSRALEAAIGALIGPVADVHDLQPTASMVAVIGRYAVGWDGTRWVFTAPVSDESGETCIVDWSDDVGEVVRNAVMQHAGDLFDASYQPAEDRP